MSVDAPTAQPSFIGALLGDGRPLFFFTAGALAFAGVFAGFLAATGSFLPHDVAFLGMQTQELCKINQCRIVHFMLHDRMAFGGVLVAMAALYAWVTAFPLRRGEAWSWWLLVVAGAAGFASFLAYHGYGYLDTWHAWATSALLPVYLAGLAKTRFLVRDWPDLRALFRPGWVPELWCSRGGMGRLLLLGAGLGMIGAGVVILITGMTAVFVPQDIGFIGLTGEQMTAINPRLVPLIAHDRAGFGGGLVTTGLFVAGIVWKARPERPLLQALGIAGLCGFGCAIGVHYPIGYVDPIHLAPAWVGACIFTSGWLLTWKSHQRPDHAAQERLVK